MKRMKYISVVIASAIILGQIASGCSILISEEEDAGVGINVVEYTSEASLNTGYYVWHDENENNIRNDLGDVVKDYGIFFPVYANLTTFDTMISYNNVPEGKPKRLIWLVEEELDCVPTFYQGDELILCSSSYRPQEIIFERFRDDGYTVGLSFLQEDGTGRYCINTEQQDGVTYIFPLSDAYSLAEQYPDTNITIDKFGEQALREDNISPSGTIMGLKKDEKYSAEVYIGTIAHSHQLTADAKTLVSMECFVTNEYELVNSHIAVIHIPNYLKTGYYYVDGFGLMRYIAEGDTYNGYTDFNEPICHFDENGNLIYDPSVLKLLDETVYDTERGIE